MTLTEIKNRLDIKKVELGGITFIPISVLESISLKKREHGTTCDEEVCHCDAGAFNSAVDLLDEKINSILETDPTRK